MHLTEVKHQVAAAQHQSNSALAGANTKNTATVTVRDYGEHWPEGYTMTEQVKAAADQINSG